jgi:phosphoinositide-3-kinase, regulatory subunit 4
LSAEDNEVMDRMRRI